MVALHHSHTFPVYAFFTWLVGPRWVAFVCLCNFCALSSDKTIDEIGLVKHVLLKSGQLGPVVKR